MESSLLSAFNYEANVLAYPTKYFPSAWFKREAAIQVGCSSLNSPFAVSSALANRSYQVSRPELVFFILIFFSKK